jgi:taurine--2-oxoglutarate transaminase
MFAVLELVRDRETKEPLAPWNAKPNEMGVMAEVPGALRDRGVYAQTRWNFIFVVPPLIINDSQLHDGLAVLDEVLEITDQGCR